MKWLLGKFLVLITCFFVNDIYAQVAAPELTCVRNFPNVQDGDAELFWQLPSVSCGTVIGYIIFSSSNRNGPYLPELNVLNASQTSVTIANKGFGFSGNVPPDDTVYFFMQTLTNGCSQTPLNSDTLSNVFPHPEVQPKYVSVEGNQTCVSWENTNRETVEFVVYAGPGFTNPLDTVDWPNTIYKDSRDPNAGPYTYYIRERSACEDNDLTDLEGNVSFSEPHNSILLKSGTPDLCNRSVLLEWNAYNNYAAGIVNYVADITHVVSGVVTKEQALIAPNTVFYTVTDLENNEQLSARVGAILPSGDTAWSQIVGPTTISVAVVPDDAYIRSAMITSDTIIVDFYDFDPIGSATGGRMLEKSTNGGLTFVNSGARIGDVTPAPPVRIVEYIDPIVSPEVQEYSYRFVATGSCPDDIFYSGTLNTMVLNLVENIDYNVSLFWNEFNIDNGTLVDYTINRYRNGVLDGTPLSVSTAGFTDLAVFDPTDEDTWDTVCYEIIANYDIALPNGFNEQGLTNIALQKCIFPEKKIILPNAFAPLGTNRLFRPILQFIRDDEIASFSLEIYNRGSQKIYETDNYRLGWNGFHDGKLAEMDNYIYYAKIELTSGDLVERSGALLMLK